MNLTLTIVHKTKKTNKLYYTGMTRFFNLLTVWLTLVIVIYSDSVICSKHP